MDNALSELLHGIDNKMVIALSIMLAAYYLIFSERLQRANAAILGATVMVGAGLWFDFYTQEAAIRAIDGNTILLLLGMMIAVAMLRQTGGFEYIAIRVAKSAAHNPLRLLFFLTLAVSTLSMFLDNVTTMIVFAPLTVLITRMLNLNPAPFLMAEAMLSNIGGAMTLVGDPPNIIIGSAANFHFTDFLARMSITLVPTWIVVFTLITLLFHKSLRPEGWCPPHIDLDESQAIRDPKGLIELIVTMIIVLILFFLHHRLNLYPAYVAFIGTALAVTLTNPDMETLLRDLDWNVLIFFSALFVIVGGLESSGLLHQIAESIVKQTGDDQLLFSALLLIWVAALVSAIIDNIPFTITMVPIISGLGDHGVNIEPLWWALAIGVGLGANGTHIGAAANIISVNESKRSGMTDSIITPVRWAKMGLPVMFVSLITASTIFKIFFVWFH